MTNGENRTCKQTEQTLLCLRNLSSSLHSTTHLETILDRLLEQSVRMLAAEGGLVALCCSGEVSICRSLSIGETQPENCGAPGSKTAGRVAIASHPLISNDTGRDPQVDAWRGAARGAKTLLSVPITSLAGELIGYLEILNKREPGGFTAVDLEQLAMAAQIAAQAISNAMAYRKIVLDTAVLEERVAQRTAQLQEMNEELENFASSVSHNLRAPLRAIQGFAEILLENRDQQDQLQREELLDRILRAIRDMDQSIQDLLGYSRVSRQELLSRRVSLLAVVREAVKQLEVGHTGPRYAIEVPEQLPEVSGDYAMLVQVLLIILSNAVTYLAPGVTPKVKIWGEEQDATVRLFVQDNGIGIAPQDQERVFEVFERLHGVESYPGTGIGLAIVRKAVARLGGKVGVQSRPGEGSRFWIELPRPKEEDLKGEP